jgi:hypothetical protein
MNRCTVHYTTPGLSFAPALRNNAGQLQKPHPRRVPVASPAAAEKPNVPAPKQHLETVQSIRAAIANGKPFDNMLRVVTVVQKIVTELNGAVRGGQNSGHYKIVISLMKQNGHLIV